MNFSLNLFLQETMGLMSASTKEVTCAEIDLDSIMREAIIFRIRSMAMISSSPEIVRGELSMGLSSIPLTELDCEFLELR